MRMIIRDNVIWTKHLEADDGLYRLVSALGPGETVELSVDGIAGRWEKMRSGPNGQPTPGLKPTGAMQAVWAEWQKRRGEAIEIEPIDERDSYLAGLGGTLNEWMSAEDEEAFGKLRAL